ncbi:MAG: UvrD-helicase domain-containing protein [Candidatus Andersenbacteria bacterium]|nr:UvrD-helicase domain-containing protein [Candidatus Andersenbacteria bacterium]
MKSPLDGLNPDQQKVVLATHGPVLVLAGAGSGKTRALTHRIAYLIQQGIAKPEEILAVTFTNKASAEMKHRIQELLGSSTLTPRAVSTFHSMGVKILREQAHAHTRSRGFSILDSKDSEKLVRRILKNENYSLKEWGSSAVRGMISKIKQEYVDTPVFPVAQNPREEMIQKVFPKYEQMLAEHDAYDFDDLLRVPLRILRENQPVRDMYQARWKFLSIDEYQDTNAIQDEIISLLLGKDRNICVVGDDYQAIYSWRGASVDHIMQFEQRYPGCTTILLTQNYRSTPNILDAANTVIAQNIEQKHKTLWTTEKEGEDIRVLQLSSDRAEAEWVCKGIREYVAQGGRLRDCAVLYRTNAQSRLMEEQFLTHRVPYTIVGGFRFYDRKEIKDALAILSFFLSPSSRVHFERVADALLKRVGPKTIDRWESTAKEYGISLQAYLEYMSDRSDIASIISTFQKAREQTFEKVSDLLEFLVTNTKYLETLTNLPDGKEREENIQELFNVASAYTTTEQFLEDTALLSDIDKLEDQQDRVTCMTMHASKGLEFLVVYIIGCEEGLLPHNNSISSQPAIEEERRLLYVGMTRARKKLTVTYSAYRYIGGEMTPQAPSRFLEQLPQAEQTFQESNENTFSTHGSDVSDFLHEEPTLVLSQAGSYVHHPQFGKGVVIGTSQHNLTCVFEGHGVKSVPANSCTQSA